MKTRQRYLSLALALGASLGFFAPGAMAEEKSSTKVIPAQKVAEIMIRQDLFSNQRVIRDISLDLALEEKAILYMNFERQPLNTALLNLLPTFGSASYQQGDYVGGVSMTILDIIGWSSLAFSWFSGGYGSSGFLSAGLFSLGLGRLVGITSPFMHAGLYNTKLKESLALDGHYSTKLQSETLLSANWAF
ncbi:MAG: P13 family porin [Candidatus Sericytochromatia bacterium]